MATQVEFRDTGLLDPGMPFPHVLARRAAETPERPFLQEVGGAAVTFGEFHQSVLTWGDAFARLDVGRENVATMLPPSIDAHRAWLGLSWIGATEVPLNVDYRGRMLVYALTQCDTQILVTTSAVLERVAEIAPAVAHLHTVVLTDDAEAPDGLPFRIVTREEFLEKARPAEGLEGPAPWDPACIIYTSGTTGPSKGVVDPWPLVYLQAIRTFPLDELTADDCFYGPFPVFHLSGKFPPYLMAVLGGRLAIRERFSFTDFWSDVEAFGCTTTIMSGAIANLLYRAPEQPNDAETTLHNLISAAPVIAEFEDFGRRFGVRIATCYAMTELGPVLGRGFGQITPGNRESCGVPFPEYDMRIVDEHDLEVPPGVTGELIVRSGVPWTLNGGYYGMAEKTAESWRNGWFHTGDAFRRDQRGSFSFVDRIKDCIRRRGENISSFEVEAYVMEHPSVLECAAIPVAIGKGEEEVKVVLVRKPDVELTPEELIEFLIPRMPRFMVPRFVEFVDALPKTETMKVRKVELGQDPLNENTWDREKAGITLPR